MRWIPSMLTISEEPAKRLCQSLFSSSGGSSCLLSTDNLAFVWDGGELYTGGLGRSGRNIRDPVKPLGNVLLVPDMAALCPLPIAPKSFLTLSLSNAPIPLGSSFNLKSSWTEAAVPVFELCILSPARAVSSVQHLWVSQNLADLGIFYPLECAGPVILQNTHSFD